MLERRDAEQQRATTAPSPHPASRAPGPVPPGWGAPAILRLQRLAGNAATVTMLRPAPSAGGGAPGGPTLQRYFLGHASATTSATVLSAQVKQADTSFRDPTDATHKRTARVGVDPTVVPGTGIEPLRISEDGRMAIENTNDARQAKVFFADATILKASNKKLAEVGSKYLLQVCAPGAITVTDDKGTKTRVLDAIEVVVNPLAGQKGKSYKKIAPTLGGQQHGPDTPVAATCNAVAEAIIGHSDMPAKDRLKALKLLSPGDQAQWSVGLADAMTKGGSRSVGALDNTTIPVIAAAYANLLAHNRPQALKIAKLLKVNEYAQAKVGQAYFTDTIGLVLGVGEKGNWDAAIDAGTSNPALKVNDASSRSGKRRVAWGNHVGAVVAASAGNTVTFENYARDAEEGATVADDVVGYFAMYGPVTKGQTWHEVWSGGATPIHNALTAVV